MTEPHQTGAPAASRPSGSHGATRTIYVTGAGGYVGRALCASLTADGFRVVAIARSGKCANAAVSIAADLATAHLDLPDARPGDTLVHLAAKAHQRSASAEAFHRDTIAVAATVAQAVERSAIRRLVHISSIGARIAAEDPANSRVYGRAKLAAEEEFARLGATVGADVITLRPPAIYGGDAPGNFAILAKLIARGVPLPVGGATAARSYLHRDNLVDAITILCGLDDAVFGRFAGTTYEISDKERWTTRQVAEVLARQQGRTIRLFNVPETLLRMVARVLRRSDQVDGAFAPLVAAPLPSFCDDFGWEPHRSLGDQ